MRRLSRHIGTRRGQAVTEFALVAPIVATLVLFASYFYELFQLRLKAQEAARYVAWEFTGHPLHDYGEVRQGSYFNRARAEILADATARYANLRSTDMLPGSSYLTVEWSPPVILVRDLHEPRIPSGRDLIGFDLNYAFDILGWLLGIYRVLSFRHRNWILTAMIAGYWSEEVKFFGAGLNQFNPPGRWGFNTRGYPRATVRFRFKPLIIPRRFLEGVKGFFSKRHYGGRVRTIRETTAVVADSWRLHYGEAVDNTKSHDADDAPPYWKAVDRMAFVSPMIRNGLKTLVGAPMMILFDIVLMGVPSSFTNLSADPAVFFKTTLVSKPYTEARPTSGRISLVEDDMRTRSYDTSPMLEGEEGEGSEYKQAFSKRGSYFMGCAEPERLTCGASLSSDNPFGDYIIPPPQAH